MKSRTITRKEPRKWLGVSLARALVVPIVSAVASNAPSAIAAETNAPPLNAGGTNALPAAPSPRSTNAPPTVTSANTAPAVVGTNAPPVASKTNAPPAVAGGTNAPPAAEGSKNTAPKPLTPQQFFEGGTNNYSNWIDVGAGGGWTGGNKAQAQAQHGASRGAFGGIEDFHYQSITEKYSLNIDGRALPGQNDYKFSADLRRDEFGYLRFSYDQYRVWYNSSGGYYPPTGQFYQLSDDAFGVNRGNFSFEGGLTPKEGAQVTFKYNHSFRVGEKSSTEWGITHPTPDVTQGLSPTSNKIDEHSDSFQVDVTKGFKLSDVGIGMRYENGQVNNGLRITQSPGEAGQQRITDQQGTTYDLFNIHTFTETRIRTNLVASAAFSYSGLDNQFYGSRTYGNNFDAGYTPMAQNGAGYYGLLGNSHLDEYVYNLSLMYKPRPTLAIIPSMRTSVQHLDARASGVQTLAAYNPVAFGSLTGGSRVDIRERLDINYTGFTNSTLYARGEWTEGSGNLNENGGLVPVNGIGVPPVQQLTEDSRFFQKYSGGIRWYPSRRAIVDVGGDYKINRYDYDHTLDSTPNDPFSVNRYPAYLVNQGIEAYGGKIRLTLRPLQNVTAVSRYEYQESTIHTRPDSVSGLGEVESSVMQSHIIGQDVSWTPWSRLNLQAGVSYVLSKTTTPASAYTQAILDAQNNYWTVNFNSTLVVDDKTVLRCFPGLGDRIESPGHDRGESLWTTFTTGRAVGSNGGGVRDRA